MKKSMFGKSLITILIACVILILSACTSSEEESPVNTEVEGTLTVTGTELTDSYIKEAIKTFQKQYPNVTVDYDYIADINLFTNQVISNLNLAGSLDLVVFPYNWSTDIETLLSESDSFCDWNTFIDADDEFRHTDYVENVIDSCEWNGKQVFMPLSYILPVYITTQENMEALGVELESTSDLPQFFNSLRQFQQQYDLFGVQGTYYSDAPFPDPHSAVTLMGIQPINYSSGTVNNIFTQEFNESISFINSFQLSRYGYVESEYPYERGALEASEAIRRHQILFTYTDETFTQWYTSHAALKDQSVMYFPTPSVDGRIYAHPQAYAGIAENSTNKEAAYLFLKVLLSEETQNRLEEYGMNIPVRKESIDYLHTIAVERALSESDLFSTSEGEQYLDLIKNPDAVTHCNYVFQHLTQYTYLIGDSVLQEPKRLLKIEEYFTNYLETNMLPSTAELHEQIGMLNESNYRELYEYYGWNLEGYKEGLLGF